LVFWTKDWRAMEDDLFFYDDEEGTNDAIVTHQTLVDTQERLGVLLDQMPTGLIIHQMQSVMYANKVALNLLNADKKTVVGHHFLDKIAQEQHETISEQFMSCFMKDEFVRFDDITLTNAEGEERNLQVTAGRLPWEGTQVIQILLEDVTALRKQAEDLRRLTYFDELTQTYNRRHFLEHATEKLKEAIEQESAFGLLIFDLDWFKKINDTYGHLAGDEALKSVSKVWNENTRHKNHLRENDATLSRIGGEEFAVCLFEGDEDTLKAIAERIRTTLNDHPITYEDQKFTISASFGGTLLKTGDQKLDDLIRRADEALYEAKENGRNQVIIHL
jgi:diguanylate cyclase (GGDEF)-like protein/PAS domain S-box-containing protein